MPLSLKERPAERSPSKPSNATRNDKSITLREAKSILAKLGDQYVGTAHKNKQLHEVLFGTLRRYPGIKEAERLATLQNVDSFTVGGEKLSAEKLDILQTLIKGWKPLRKLTATGTTGGFAAWICSHAPAMDFLEKLELDHTDVTDSDLKALQGCAKLRQLRRLELIETPCGDAIFPAVSSLKNLVRIDLYGTRIGCNRTSARR